MHTDEFEELTECVSCGAAITPAKDRAFESAPRTFLCWECAIERGGVYDDTDDTWTTPPNVQNLPTPLPLA